jgi:glycosyltransferase involved in cell wall biosynthesis
MRIALINEYFPPFAPGGAEWSGLELARAFVTRGHGVVVITPNYGASARETLDGVEVVRFPFPARLGNRRTLPLRWLASPIYYLWSALAVIWYAGRFRADVLHAQNKYSLPGAWLAGRLLNRPVIVTLRDTLLACPFGRCFMLYEHVPAGCGKGALWDLCREEHIANYIRPRSLLHRLKAGLTASYLRLDLRIRQWSLARADGVIAVSHGIERLYREAGIDLGGQMQVIHNIPPSPARLPSEGKAALRCQYGLGEGPLVLYGGKFSPGKGTSDLVAAAHLIVDQSPDVEFVFAGGSELAGSKGAGYIHVVGRIPNADFLQLCAIAQVVVVPSVWPEPLSRVALEAMAIGTPVVATAVGGTPEIVAHEVNGLLVPRSDPAALAQAITTLLHDEEKRRRLGQGGRILAAQRFTPTAAVDQHLLLYKAIHTQL